MAGEPQRRVGAKGYEILDSSDALHPQNHLESFGFEMKRGNLYAEQGRIVSDFRVARSNDAYRIYQKG